MARIAGINIPIRKHLVIALTYIYGIGRPTAKNICDKVGIAREKIVSELLEEEIIRLREVIEKDYITESDLKRSKDRSIRRLISIRCFRGLRHQARLPVRGQRSHTNARTRKLGIN